MLCAMQKLSQLSLSKPKALQGIIRCRRIQALTRQGDKLKWKTKEEIKLGFTLYSSCAERVKQLVQANGEWNPEVESKRKSALIPRVPSFVSKEAISLLFPYSINVQPPKPKSGHDHPKGTYQGFLEVEFESRAWMEAVLSCLRDFYITQVGGCNPVWRLKVVNFRPKPVKLTDANVPRNMPSSKDRSQNKRTLKAGSMRSGFDSPSASNTLSKGGSRKRPHQVSTDEKADGGQEKRGKMAEGLSASNVTPTAKSDDGLNKENLKLLAHSRGLDPNNSDVLRILEVQTELSSIQAMFSCIGKEGLCPEAVTGENQKQARSTEGSGHGSDGHHRSSQKPRNTNTQGSMDRRDSQTSQGHTGSAKNRHQQHQRQQQGQQQRQRQQQQQRQQQLQKQQQQSARSAPVRSPGRGRAAMLLARLTGRRGQMRVPGRNSSGRTDNIYSGRNQLQPLMSKNIPSLRAGRPDVDFQSPYEPERGQAKRLNLNECGPDFYSNFNSSQVLFSFGDDGKASTLNCSKPDGRQSSPSQLDVPAHKDLSSKRGGGGSAGRGRSFSISSRGESQRGSPHRKGLARGGSQRRDLRDDVSFSDTQQRGSSVGGSVVRDRGPMGILKVTGGREAQRGRDGSGLKNVDMGRIGREGKTELFDSYSYNNDRRERNESSMSGIGDYSWNDREDRLGEDRGTDDSFTRREGRGRVRGGMGFEGVHSGRGGRGTVGRGKIVEHLQKVARADDVNFEGAGDDLGKERNREVDYSNAWTGRGIGTSKERGIGAGREGGVGLGAGRGVGVGAGRGQNFEELIGGGGDGGFVRSFGKGYQRRGGDGEFEGALGGGAGRDFGLERERGRGGFDSSQRARGGGRAFESMGGRKEDRREFSESERIGRGNGGGESESTQHFGIRRKLGEGGSGRFSEPDFETPSRDRRKMSFGDNVQDGRGEAGRRMREFLHEDSGGEYFKDGSSSGLSENQQESRDWEYDKTPQMGGKGRCYDGPQIGRGRGDDGLQRGRGRGVFGGNIDRGVVGGREYESVRGGKIEQEFIEIPKTSDKGQVYDAPQRDRGRGRGNFGGLRGVERGGRGREYDRIREGEEQAFGNQRRNWEFESTADSDLGRGYKYKENRQVSDGDMEFENRRGAGTQEFESSHMSERGRGLEGPQRGRGNFVGGAERGAREYENMLEGDGGYDFAKPQMTERGRGFEGSQRGRGRGFFGGGMDSGGREYDRRQDGEREVEDSGMKDYGREKETVGGPGRSGDFESIRGGSRSRAEGFDSSMGEIGFDDMPKGVGNTEPESKGYFGSRRGGGVTRGSRHGRGGAGWRGEKGRDFDDEHSGYDDQHLLSSTRPDMTGDGYRGRGRGLPNVCGISSGGGDRGGGRGRGDYSGNFEERSGSGGGFETAGEGGVRNTEFERSFGSEHYFESPRVGVGAGRGACFEKPRGKGGRGGRGGGQENMRGRMGRGTGFGNARATNESCFELEGASGDNFTFTTPSTSGRRGRTSDFGNMRGRGGESHFENTRGGRGGAGKGGPRGDFGSPQTRESDFGNVTVKGAGAGRGTGVSRGEFESPKGRDGKRSLFGGGIGNRLGAPPSEFESSSSRLPDRSFSRTPHREENIAWNGPVHKLLSRPAANQSLFEKGVSPSASSINRRGSMPPLKSFAAHGSNDGGRPFGQQLSRGRGGGIGGGSGRGGKDVRGDQGGGMTRGFPGRGGSAGKGGIQLQRQQQW